ncbi:hypothetical protein [uncultured Parasutterella sp.]|uniref:hypothetical protein n=1 Tax=uncultured Parasutterella sp. TaxID=1263098 RepID=UPI00272CA967|nr:hypothetical protein [uncultured Parasutterella sp.]
MKNHLSNGHLTMERTKSDFVRAVFFSAHLILLRTRWTIKPVGSDGWSLHTL